MATDVPSSVPSVFQPFVDAAAACAEATQSQKIATSPIEHRGWTRHTQPAGAPPSIGQYWRQDVRFAINVLGSEPAQCEATWSVTSSSGREAVFSNADREVSLTLAQAFPGKFQPSELRVEGDKKVHRFDVGSAVVIVSMDSLGPNSALLRVAAVNRQSLAN
jgi:hypothetical protein